MWSCIYIYPENDCLGKLPKYYEDPTVEELTKTLDCWPSMNDYITTCKYVSMSSFQIIYKGHFFAILMTDILQVLMPWKFKGCYALFGIDHGKKHVTFIDFAPTQDWCKHMPYKRFAEAIIIISKKYKIAYNKKRTGWTEDIFKWQHTIQPGVPIDLKEYFLHTIFLAILIFFLWFLLYIT
jgi:hypothetical protein